MKILAMVLAGGEGKRLLPLTAERAKPAVPFGGRFRIIDFVLSNLVSSNIHHIKVLTQYKSDSLIKHLTRNWGRFAGFGGFIEPLPPQMNVSKNWYEGSVDAIFQNLNIVRDEAPELVVIFGADNIYKMDVGQMVDFHEKKGGVATLAAIPVPIAEATRFGCIAVDEDGRMVDFLEKPANPPEMPNRPGYALASMGNYIFESETLIREVRKDAGNPKSGHDFGGDLIPALFKEHPVYVYDFSTNIVPGEEEETRGYWVDVGTIEAYHEASMDLVSVSPTLNLYNHQWPIRSFSSDAAPAKFVFADSETKRLGIATDSMVCEGCIISGAHIERSILSPNVMLHSYAHVSECIILEGAVIGRHCKIRRAIIDKGVEIPEHTVIGYDRAEDEARFAVSSSGIVIIPKGGHLSEASRTDDI